MGENATTPTEKSELAPKPARQRKWRRRFIRAAMVILTLLIVVRIALFFLLGFVVSNVGHLYGVDIAFNHQQLTLFAGDAGLWDVTVKARDSGHELLRADYVRGKISTFALLSGRLHASRVEADGTSISILRDANGRIQTLEDVLIILKKLEERNKNRPPTAPDFTAPLSIDALRLQHVQITLRDEMTNPVFATVLNADVRLDDLQRADNKPAAIEADVWAENVLDVMRVRGKLSGFGRKLNTHLMIEGRGLNLASAGGYLTPFGLSPVEFDELRGLDFDAKISLDTSAANTPTGLTGTLKIEDVSAADADGVAAALKRLQLDITLLDFGKLHFGKLAIEGGRLNARRTEQGRLRFAGIEFGVPDGPINQTVQTKPAKAPTTQTTQPTTRPALEVILPTVELRDMLARFEDDAITPKSAIEMHLTQLDGAVKMEHGYPSTFDFTGKVESKGLAKSVDLSGTILPFKSPYSASLNFAANGITLEGLRGYLAPLGIEPTFKDGTAAGTANLAVALSETGASFDAKFDKLVVKDGEQNLQLSEIAIDRFMISPDASRIRLESVALVGPELTIRHESSGDLSLIGFRIDPKKLLASSATTQPTTQPTTLATTQPAKRSNPLAGLPRIELGALTWSGVRVRLEDDSTAAQQIFNLTDAGLEVHDLLIDMNSIQTSATPGTMKAWFSVPSVAGRFDLDGTFTSAPNALHAELNVKGHELNLVTLQPYLESTPVQTTLAKGSLAAKLKLHLASSPDALSLDFALTDASIRDDQNELGGVDRLSIAGLRYDGASLAGKSITIDKPRAKLLRDKDNTLAAMGIRVPTPTPNKTPGDIFPLPNIPLAISFGELVVNDASLELTDHFPKTPVETVITSSVKISPVSLGPKSSPMKVEINAAIKDAIGKASVVGVTDLANNQIRATLDIDAREVTFKSISGYLPPEISSTLQSGQFKVALDAQASANEAGGRSIKIAVNKLDWRDGDNVLALVDRLGVDVERIDVINNITTINSLESSGVESQATVNADGSLDALGFRITPAPDSAEPEPEPAIIVTDAVGQTDVKAQVASNRKTLPFITINKLNLGLKRFSITDASRPSAAPIELADVTVTNATPIQAGGTDAEALPPIDIAIKAALKPLTGMSDVHLVVTPFAQQPKLSIDLLASGISGEGITKLVPEIAKRVDGSRLVNGQFKTKLEAELALDRRSPTDFNFARGFGAEINLTGTEFRNDPNGAVVLGLDSAQVSALKVLPNFASVTIRELNVQRPIVRAHREADGFHAFGLFVPFQLKKLTSESFEESGEAEFVVQDSEPKRTPTTKPKPLPEVRIDTLVVQNIDLILEDRSVTPQLVIPIDELDLEVKGLNTLALSEPRAIRFNALVGSGNVSLPKRVSGVPHSERPMEERPLLTRVAATGRMTLFPALDGYVKINVTGAELVAFSGEAKDIADITLQDGFVDLRIDARFRDGGNLDLTTRTVLTDLSLKEPPNGLIQRELKLPAPTDEIINLIQDPGGSITLPINVPIRAGEINIGSVKGSIVGAASQVVLTAVASAPAKILGIGGEGPPAPDDVVLSFSAGDAFISPEFQMQIESLVQKMRKDKNLHVTIRHDMGSADLERALVRSNPTRDDAESLANGLRAEKLALLAERQGLAVAAQAELATRPESQAEALNRLRAMDARIAEIDSAMGELFDLLKKGADLQATARQRNAAATLARVRLEAVRSMLIREDVFESDQRVQAITPSLDPAVEGAGRIVIMGTTKQRAK